MTETRHFGGEEIVTALYRGLLGREPDSDGATSKQDRLDAGTLSIDDLVCEIASSPEFATGIPNLLNRLGNAGHQRFTNDVSQYGETMILLRHWVAQANASPFVVDVGARGRERSNSYDLLKQFGWSGLLIEANADLIVPINAEFAGLDYRLEQCAVSNYDGTAVLTLGINDDVSSLSNNLAAAWGDTRGSQSVEVRRLAGILHKHRVAAEFGLLSLDIEGEDIAVLNDLVENSAYRPDWVIIEASYDFAVSSLDDAPFCEAVKAVYELRDRTSANLILRRR